MDRLKDHDAYLLERGHEQAITHRLALYLQDEFPDWHVDVEFNRNLGDAKRLTYARIGEPEPHKHGVRPDIIVHQRGKRQNLLIVEAKKQGEGVADTEAKLRAATGQGDALNYGFGVLVILPTRDRPVICNWFQRGQQIENSTGTANT
ncbi:MAG: hypothetical protein KBG84_00275 [Planctomycetes bacterium]|nr:hypothetical protein [Planctomycetota bacterium]